MTTSRKPGSKRLVIDASIARAAGGENATHPTSTQCTDFLRAVLRICHHFVMTEEIRAEWNKHQSAFAREWRVSMIARKKMFVARDVENPALRQQVDQLSVSARDCEAMFKDLCLIEAALATDRIVISLDETVRALFIAATNDLEEMKVVLWVNPTNPDEMCLEWLENSAPSEPHRCLGYRP